MTDHWTQFTQDILDGYGYTPREDQSKDVTVVPIAMLQEALIGLPPGDSKAILERIVNKSLRDVSS